MHLYLKRFATLLAVLLATVSVAKESEESAQQALEKALAPMLKADTGLVSAEFKHLKTGATYKHNAERRMSSASLIKLAVMVAAYDADARGILSLDDRVTLREEDKVPGSGILTPHFSAGTDLSLRDAIRLMMSWSDNTSTNLVIDALGRTVVDEGDNPAKAGIGVVNDMMKRLGYDNIRLNARVYRRVDSVDLDLSKKYGLGLMAPDETVDLCERVYQGNPFGEGHSGVDEPASDAEASDETTPPSRRKEMLDHLRSCQDSDKVPQLLPKRITVAHKTGYVSKALSDAGIIESPAGPIAFCVMVAEDDEHTWNENADPKLLMAQIGKAAYDYFTEGAGAIDAPQVARVLRMGQGDPLVEPLQRTLNLRLKPSPDLAVDGDFGPNTQKALKAFQKQAKISVTGEADAATWKALGPLAMEARPVPSPAEAMKDLPPLESQDPLNRPVTSCPAWAIADGETGKILWGKNDSVVRDPASTTKMMTGFLVCKLAEQDPKVLDEVITFSKRADETSGSTSGVRAGEQVTAGELLYGLMLPSGNDASVAFAEHFGDRFPGEEGDKPYDRFIKAMNAEAKRLGMDKTGYRNTHGLTADGHVTSAGDLVKLAHEAMQNDTFRKVVATRRYGTTLQSTAGYERNVVWNNTDRLLRYEGFYGVKTGTTGPAGACLVSAGERGEKPLYVVVLGADSGDNRYLDARNLYRWAWHQLGVE